MADTLYIVVPCYNEEQVLDVTAGRLLEKIKSLEEGGAISPESFLADSSSVSLLRGRSQRSRLSFSLMSRQEIWTAVLLRIL